MIYTLQEIVEQARKSAPYFERLYRNLPHSEYTIRDLPPLDQASFWAANSFEKNEALSAPLDNGVIYKSGGTTGAPKFSVYTREEWESFTTSFGRGLALGGLERGSKVANLFYAGELYASFLFITRSLESSPEPIVHLPLAGSASMETVLKTLEDFKVDVVAGVPTTLIALAAEAAARNKSLPFLRKVLFGGESMYADQRARMLKQFPQLHIQSIGYASVDAGLLGYATPDCMPDEHRSFEPETIMEILDEDTFEAVDEPHRPGRLFVTNLTRKLMPILRYPVGDRAEWVEPSNTPHRKFRILGRSDEGARVGPVTLYYEDTRSLLDKEGADLGFQDFQIIVLHKNERDQLLLRVAVSDLQKTRDGRAADRLREALYKARPMLRDLVEQDKVLAPSIEWVTLSQLERNTRTGKLRRIIDRRNA